MPYVTTRFGAIFYLARGSADVALMAVHGAGGTSRHWGHQLGALNDIARVIALDLPGHGRSAGRAQASVAAATQCVLATMDALDLPRAVLAGHSLGGAIAQSVALTAPERCAGLVLIGTAARLQRPALLDSLRQDWLATTQRLTQLVYAPGTPAAILEAATVDLRKTSPNTLDTDYASASAADLTEYAQFIVQPTLIIVGAEDRLTPPAAVARLAAALPDADMVLVPRAGHMALIEQPQLVNTAIRTFLSTKLLLNPPTPKEF